jgi:hypothetical protein
LRLASDTVADQVGAATRRLSVRGWLFISCLVLLFAADADPASADSIQISSGTARVMNTGGGAVSLTFEVAGSDFTAVGGWDLGLSNYLTTCRVGCSPGQLVSLSTLVFNNDLLDASIGELGAVARITHNGALVNPPSGVVELLGFVTFTTSVFALPVPPPGADGIMVTLPFVLGGTVLGYDPFPRDPVLLFSADVAGGGIATAGLPFNTTTGSYAPFFTLRYDFGSPAPIPEPASLLLLSTGVGAIAFRTRRARRRRVSTPT